MATRIVGVMGPGATATPEECCPAERLGALIANEGWTTLTGIVDGEQRSPAARSSSSSTAGRASTHRRPPSGRAHRSCLASEILSSAPCPPRGVGARKQVFVAALAIVTAEGA